MRVSSAERGSIVTALGNCEIFEGLTRRELTRVSPFFEFIKFRSGEYIFMEGDPSDWLYIVTEKRIKIVKNTQSGKEVLLEIKSPGEMFCCTTVLDNKPYPESAQAKGAASVVRISRKNFLTLIGAFPVIKVGIARYLTHKLIDAYDMLKNISMEIVERRIASTLLKLSEKVGIDNEGYRKIDFALTRQEVADMVGTTIETSIRTMSKFEKMGIIKSTRKDILVNTEGLRKFLHS